MLISPFSHRFVSTHLGTANLDDATGSKSTTPKPIDRPGEGTQPTTTTTTTISFSRCHHFFFHTAHVELRRSRACTAMYPARSCHEATRLRTPTITTHHHPSPPPSSSPPSLPLPGIAAVVHGLLEGKKKHPHVGLDGNSGMQCDDVVVVIGGGRLTAWGSSLPGRSVGRSVGR
jgi:hypothetical protein